MAFCPSVARAQDQAVWAAETGSEGMRNARLGGFFTSRLNLDLAYENPEEDIAEFRNGFFLKGDFDPAPRLHWTLSGRFSYKAFSSEEGNFTYYYQPELFEAYASLTLEKLDLRVGQQITRWGRADISPTDNLNPSDFRDFLFTEPEFIKIPILMVQARYYFSGYNLEGIYIPFYEPLRMPPVGDDWFVLTPRASHDYLKRFPAETLDAAEDSRLRMENTDYPEFSPQNGEAGLRFSGSRGGFDFSADYLFTWQDFFLPRFNEDFIQYVRENMAVCPPGAGDRYCHNAEEILFDLQVQELIVFPNLYYLATDRTHIIGADAATTIQQVGLRAEVALSEKVTLLNEDFSQVHKPLFQFSFGADRIFSGRHYLNLQFLGVLILDWNNKTINPENGQPLELYFVKRFMPILGGYFRTSFGEEDQYQPEIRLSYNPVFGDYLINPLISYSYSDALKLTLGAAFLAGPPKSIFGLFAQNDSAYLNLRYSF